MENEGENTTEAERGQLKGQMNERQRSSLYKTHQHRAHTFILFYIEEK